jgi:hypothetical protein
MSESVVAQLDNMLQRLDVLRALERDNEIARLRARVEVLERVLHGIAEFCEEGDRRPFIAIANTVRDALEAKP